MKRRPVKQKFPGVLGEEFNRLWDAVEALQPTPAPGMLTSQTTRGVSRKVISNRQAGTPQMLEVMILEAPIIESYGPSLAWSLGCAFTDGDFNFSTDSVKATVQDYQEKKAAWLAADGSDPVGAALAENAFFSKYLRVTIPQALQPGNYGWNGVTAIAEFITRKSMNLRQLQGVGGQTIDNGSFYVLEQVIDPPYWAATADGVATTIWVTDPSGLFLRRWGTEWMDLNIDARHWVHRSIAENSIATSPSSIFNRGSLLYAGEQTQTPPPNRWPA